LFEKGESLLDRMGVACPAWQPGQSGNPKGRPKGSKNRAPPPLWRPRFKWLVKHYQRRWSPAQAERLAIDDLAALMLPLVRVAVLRQQARGDGLSGCRWCGRPVGGADTVPVMIEPKRWCHAGCLPTLMLAVMGAARAEVLVKLRRKR
jgi:hypothetical protein